MLLLHKQKQPCTSARAVVTQYLLPMIAPQEDTSVVYALKAALRIRLSPSCDIKHVYYGWVDCREAAVDWWRMVQEKLDEPKDFEAFRILAVNPLFDTLGTPADLPEYPTPWDRFLENKEWLEMISTVVGVD